MGLINNLRKQVDLPSWEQLRFAPAITSALSSSCSADNPDLHESHARYIYFLIGTNSFWRYDTYSDTYMELASPPIAPLTWSSMKFFSANGHEGRVLGATANSFTAPAHSNRVLEGFDVRIIAGTGAGQQRVITNVALPVVADSGVATAIPATGLTDATKAWAINQWAGFQVRITFGTGVSTVRRILYNDATSLTYVDVNQHGVNYSANPQPVILSVAAGVQSVYAIESSVITVDTNWAITPDETSRFRIFSGVITLLSSAAAAPFHTMQSYDIASDTWYIRPATTGLLPAAATDASVERTTEVASMWAKGIATGGTTTTLVDNTKEWKVNEHAGRWVRIYSGTGEGQIRQVASNTATTLTWVTIGTAPTTTSRYLIDGFDAGTATSGTASTLTDSTKAWPVNRYANYLVRIVSGTGRGQSAAILSNTATALTFYKPMPIAPDATSVYAIQGDKENSYFVFGGYAGVVLNTFENSLATNARVFDEGLTRIGSAQYAGMPAIPIASVAGAGTAKTVTTAIPHGFRTGWSIIHRGDTGAAAVQNNITAVITVTGATTYTYTAPGSAAAWTLTALSTTVLKDSSKSWVVNEHANKVLYFTTLAPVLASGASTMVAMEIASNTADTLTLKTATTAPVNGISRYAICKREAIGALNSGIATGTQSTTTLQDTSKTWVVNIWAGRRLKMLSGAGQSLEIVIASNTANTLTFAATTAPIANSTSYSILGSSVRGVGINAIWAFGVTNNLFKGRYLYCARGGALAGFERLDLTTDLWELMVTAPQNITLTTGSMYAYDGNDRLHFTKEITLRNYYLDLETGIIHGAGITPYLAGTAILGNRYEIFRTADGLKYLWTNRHSFQDTFRQLIVY